MSDLITRKNVIDAIEMVDWYHQNERKDMVSGANSNAHQAWYRAEDIYKAIEDVPSVGDANIDVERLADIATKYDVKIDFEVKEDGGCEVWIEPMRGESDE